MNTEILYDDRHLCVCIKPAGIVSEEDGMPRLLSETMGGSFFCVHRLDKAVGGLMVFARDRKTAAALSDMTARRQLEKHYLAIVPDGLEADSGVMEDLMYRDRQKNKSYVVKRMRRGVREAKLEYRILERKDRLALVEIRLHTGRSHQIRCQFASRRCPLLGDARYGSSVRTGDIALWSYRLSFRHPVSGESMDFSRLPSGELWRSFPYIEDAQR